MELNIFHLDTFERLGIIDEFQLLEITTNYKKHSELELLVSATEENIDYFIANNDDIFLTAGIGSLFDIIETTEESYANKDLDESLWEICVKFDIAYEIFADIRNKRFEFVVWKGTDRSTNQTIRDAVIFSKEFDNVLSQSYTDDKSDYRNTVIIAGEGEGTARTYLVVGNENKGRKCREMFVDLFSSVYLTDSII